jgi:hypothetical protein
VAVRITCGRAVSAGRGWHVTEAVPIIVDSVSALGILGGPVRGGAARIIWEVREAIAAIIDPIATLSIYLSDVRPDI